MLVRIEGKGGTKIYAVEDTATREECVGMYADDTGEEATSDSTFLFDSCKPHELENWARTGHVA